MNAIKVDAVKRDVQQLRESYNATMAKCDAKWRAAAMEPNPVRRARLESQAHELTYAARVCAGAHERALSALKSLEGE